MSMMDRQQGRQAGVVSLMVTLVMMIVITLIVLGFAEIARNEQRSSLDDQLSTQAYYAAESGVNDARAVINQTVAGGGTPQDKNSCAPDATYTASGVVDASHNASYTCLQVDTHPAALTYSIGYDSTIVPLLSAGGVFKQFDLSWATPGDGSACPVSGSPATFTTVSSWNCPAPVVRVDLLDANGALSRANWGNVTATIFFVPFYSGSVANVGTISDRGAARGAQCSGTSTVTCKASICNNVSCAGSLGGTNYYARITTMYVQNNVTLSLTAGGTKFSGAQAVIDATGKAQDVLRRVRVAADLTDANVYAAPSGGLVSADSVCKRFGVTNTSFTVYDTPNNDLKAGGGTNMFCDPATSNPGVPTP